MRGGGLFIRNAGSRSERPVSLIAAVAVHALVLAGLMMSRPVPRLQPASVSEFTLKTVSMLPDPAPAPRVSPPPMPTPQKRPHPDPIAMTTGDSEGKSVAQNTGESCSPVDAITKSITGDAGAIAALNTLPKSERSISDAVVIWNAGWNVATTDDNIALTPVRENILRVLGGLTQKCLMETVAGPRLVQIPTEMGTTFLAIGSGTWNWGQLIDYVP